MTADLPAGESPATASPLDPVPMAPVAPAQRSGRAGRNLPAAVAVALVLGAVVLLSLYLWKVAFLGVIVVAIVLGLWELTGALAGGRISVPVVPMLIGAGAMLVAAYAGGAEPLMVALVLTCLAVVVWRLTDGFDGLARDVTAGIFASLYVPFLAGFAALMLRASDGPDRVVVFIVLVVLSDVGGYAAGVLLGRHPMAPSVSPKKSWEGFAGSMVAGMVAGALSVVLTLHGPWWAGAITGALLVLTATLGDLVESMVKRDLGIKDMGNLLPGHGGLMDRMDSLLPAAVVAWAVLSVVAPG
jgi:phosphatidate cytidylyltransferase